MFSGQPGTRPALTEAVVLVAASILITGGAGFVGHQLVNKLLSRDEKVRVLVRPTTDTRLLDGLDVELVNGDLRDPESLQAAVRGCREVFHCAADYRLWSKNPDELYLSNVEGTRALLRACLGAQVEAVVYTSSVATRGIPGDGVPGTEDTPVRLEDMIGHYKRSKYLAEEVALTYSRRGLKVFLVNPSTPIGPGDFKPTATGRIITDFLNGKMPAFVDTGLNLVAVEDVAEGHLLARDRGQPGRLYILGHQNLTLKQILTLLADITGLPAPKFKLPMPLATAIAAVDTAVTGGLFGRTPRVPLEGVRMARKKMFFDSARARKELGFAPGPVREALERAVDWYVANGYAPAPPARRP